MVLIPTSYNKNKNLTKNKPVSRLCSILFDFDVSNSRAGKSEKEEHSCVCRGNMAR